MAWKPPSAPIIPDIGEIPHKKEVSDEAREIFANMEPRGPEAIMKNVMERDQEIAEEIIAAGSASEAAVAFLGDLQAADTIKFGPEVFTKDFVALLRDEYDKVKLTLSFNDVLEIVYRVELKTPFFYFGIGTSDDKFIVGLVPIPTWHEEKALSVFDLELYVIPDFLTRIDYGKFDFDPEMTPAQVRREMIKLGFQENHDILV